MPRNSLTIGLLWHSLTSDNLGVGALTVGHMALIRSAAAEAGVKPKFKILGWADSRQPYFRDPAVDIAPLRLADFARPVGGLIDHIKDCDIVLDIGAGDSFSDIYGPARILKMIAAQNLVRLAGRPLVLSPQTLGPFKSPAIRRMAVSVMRSAALVAARDDLSVNYAREIGFEGEVVQASDVALRLPYDSPNRPPEGPIRVGINVSGLLFNGGYSRDNMFGLASDYADAVRRLVHFFRAAPYVELHFVSHVLAADRAMENSVEDDRAAALLLAKEYPGVVVAPSFRSPSEAKSYIAGMDFFVGARMHACIAAFSAGVPVVPMGYSRKFEGLFGALGYDLVADCRTDTADVILEKVKTAFANRTSIAEKVAAARDRGEQRLDLYEHALYRQLVALAEKKRQSSRRSA